ncbi:MAG: lysophospholipid acyltransferase family protein [Gaiellaceae bacterium]
MILYELLERANFRAIAHRLYRVPITGAERIPAAGSAILVANHESMFDPWLLALATPRPARYMAKAELWRVPLVGRALDAFGAFPVERGTGDGTAMSRAASLLNAGEVIGVFPQGTSKQLRERVFHRAPPGSRSRAARPLSRCAWSGRVGSPARGADPRRCTLASRSSSSRRNRQWPGPVHSPHGSSRRSRRRTEPIFLSGVGVSNAVTPIEWSSRKQLKPLG